MFESLNRTNTVREGINLDKMEFVKLRDFAGGMIKVDGFFFTNGKHGKQVVVVGNGAKINMPARAVGEFETIMADAVMLKAVLDGKLVLTDIKPVPTKMGLTTAYKFADIDTMFSK